MLDLKRREFITLLGGAAAAWPLAARAQPGERVRRIGVLFNVNADDPGQQNNLVAFVQVLERLGWTDGRNVRIEYRWGEGATGRIRDYAAELVALAPNVIVANGSPAVEPLQRMTTSLPIVFVNVIDPLNCPARGLVSMVRSSSG